MGTPSPTTRSHLLWRPVVVVASLGTAIVATSVAAHAVPVADVAALRALRGALIAATSATTLFGMAWVLRHGMARERRRRSEKARTAAGADGDTNGSRERTPARAIP